MPRDSDNLFKQIKRTLLATLWNRTENRPRAFWRVVGAFTLIIIGFQISTVVLSTISISAPSLQGLIQNVFFITIVLLVLAIWARFVDKRRFTDYGLQLGQEWVRDAAAGIVIVFSGWGLALIFHLTVGWAHISGVLSPGAGENTLSFSVALAVFISQFLLVAIWEEILFRGVVLKNTAEGFHTRWLSKRSAVLAGLIVSSLLFAVVHFDQANSLLGLSFWMLAGMVLGSVYIITDSLALPIGMHFAFNVGFNNIYGLSGVVPEATVAPTLIRPEFTGPEVFVGLSGVVNAAVVVLFAVLATGYVVVQYNFIEVKLSPVYATNSYSHSD